MQRTFRGVIGGSRDLCRASRITRTFHMPVLDSRLRAAVLFISAFVMAVGGAAQQEQPAPPLPLPPQQQEARLAEPADKIAVKEEVDDQQLHELLSRLLPKYPGVARANVTVQNGIVELEGQVTDDDVKTNVTQFVRRVEGTRLVINRMQTDDEVLTAWQSLVRSLQSYGQVISRNWLRWIVGMLIAAAGVVLAKLSTPLLNFLLRLLMQRELLRNLMASIIKSGIVLGGILLSLSFLRLTELVLSIAGVAGIVGLTLGFAFRDIGENLIASLFLGLRRPFGMGDVITVAGHTGVVQGMNMRATVLVTFDGNYVRIPNGKVFKEIVINRTSNQQYRTDLELVIPYDTSVKEVTDAVVDAMISHPAVDARPAPQLLIDRLGIEGVFVHAFYWHSAKLNPVPVKGEVLLRMKVALQKLKTKPPVPELQLLLPATSAVSEPNPQAVGEEAHDAVAKDEELSRNAASENEISTEKTMGVTRTAEPCMQEGANLLKDAELIP